MILHEPRKHIEGETVRISARVEYDNGGFDADSGMSMPDTIWYKLPKKYADTAAASANAFLLPAIPVAMFRGEDIDVRGCVSPRLAYSLKEYQKILHFWRPRQFQIVNIRYEKYDGGARRIPGRERGALLAFSGGVDSFYTLWEHLPQNEPDPDYQVTHTLFLHGFDIPLTDTRQYMLMKQAYEKLMGDLGITLIPASTNIKARYDPYVKEFHADLDADITFNTVIVAAGLLFENFIPRFYFSEDNPPNFTPPYGIIHQSVLPLFSTGKMDVIRCGGTVRKFEKISTLSKWPATYNMLRVCHKKPDGVQNCCEYDKCHKCATTTAMLDMVGALRKYQTFPRSLDKKKRLGLRWGYGSKFNISAPKHLLFYPEFLWFPRELAKYALEMGRWDYVLIFTYTWLMSKLRLYRKMCLYHIRRLFTPQ